MKNVCFPSFFRSNLFMALKLAKVVSWAGQLRLSITAQCICLIFSMANTILLSAATNLFVMEPLRLDRKALKQIYWAIDAILPRGLLWHYFQIAVHYSRKMSKNAKRNETTFWTWRGCLIRNSSTFWYVQNWSRVAFSEHVKAAM